MRVLRGLLCALLVLGNFQFLVPTVSAIGSQNVVIAQMYPGAEGIAAQEFVEIYNNSSGAVDVTGWCLDYIPSGGGSPTRHSCLTVADSSMKLWLRAGGYATFVSNEYKVAKSVTSDASFAGGIAATSGHVRLLNALGTEVDKLGWGAATNPETTAATTPANTKSLQRKDASPGFQDTDNNSSDFIQINPLLHTSGIDEIVTLIDVCPNIDDVQQTMPINYLANENGECLPDSCLNIAGLQINVPDNYDSDVSGQCVERDECSNLSGAQHDIPEYMVRGSDSDCIVEYSPLQLTEIMPNANGSDTGNEFIEIHNPTNTMIDLTLYAVKVGASGAVYSFPIGATIAPGEYRTFSDSVMKFTLVNTSSRVVLTAIGDAIFGDTGTYTSPPDGESWALIGEVWQYTNQPTPGAANRASIIEEVTVDSTDTGLTSCPAGKYRNPLTNRCRTITSDASVFATCDNDQYRNPETGRCRKITTATLTPCKDGQYRSEETNRCRNVLGASTAKPCKDNQYRSEETGRCRNVQVSSVPDAAFAVQKVKDTGMAFVGWWALGGVGLLAAGYAAWEWRRELMSFGKQLFKR